LWYLKESELINTIIKEVFYR